MKTEWERMTPIERQHWAINNPFQAQRLFAKQVYQPDIGLANEYISILEEQIMLLKEVHSKELGRLHEKIGYLEELLRGRMP